MSPKFDSRSNDPTNRRLPDANDNYDNNVPEDFKVTKNLYNKVIALDNSVFDVDEDDIE